MAHMTYEQARAFYAELERRWPNITPAPSPTPPTKPEAPMPQRTKEGKVKLYNVRTGECLERWSLDAKDIMAAAPGEWTFIAPGETVEEKPLGTDPEVDTRQKKGDRPRTVGKRPREFPR